MDNERQAREIACQFADGNGNIGACDRDCNVETQSECHRDFARRCALEMAEIKDEHYRGKTRAISESIADFIVKNIMCGAPTEEVISDAKNLIDELCNEEKRFDAYRYSDDLSDKRKAFDIIREETGITSTMDIRDLHDPAWKMLLVMAEWKNARLKSYRERVIREATRFICDDTAHYDDCEDVKNKFIETIKKIEL